MTSLAVAILGLLLLPALASAETYEVNTLEDSSEFGGCVNPSTFCSLRDAILRANENVEVADAIIFNVIGGTIELGSELPSITEPVTIDGSTAANYEGEPVIEIDGTQSGAENGFAIESSQVEIKALAIGGFQTGILFGGGLEGTACGNWVGVDLSGEVAQPNGIGIGIGGEASNTRIGGVTCGNVISGNDSFGLVDFGQFTRMSNNLIGTDSSGAAPLPNGVGVRIDGNAFGARVVPFGEGGDGNTIAFNDGVGVSVQDASSEVAIFGNSIFANGGLGIEVGGDATPAPTITSFEREPVTKVTGTFAGEPDTTYYIDLYSNEECDPSGSGEGQTYLGFEQVVTDASGEAEWTAADLFGAPAGENVITATGTHVFSGEGVLESTSEFSGCFPPLPSPPPPKPAQPIVPLAKTNSLIPENGETLAVEPKGGTVYIKLPGQKKQTKLEAGQLIPVGSIIDATHGKVILTSINKAGETQTAVFYGGKFLVAQRDGSGLVTLKLRGGNFSSCKGSAGSSGATASGRSGRRLWGSGKGKFRTEGSYGSATVRGTIWLTEDRCSGTFFKVRRGVVTIRDFPSSTSFALPAGKSYLAQK